VERRASIFSGAQDHPLGIGLKWPFSFFLLSLQLHFPGEVLVSSSILSTRSSGLGPSPLFVLTQPSPYSSFPFCFSDVSPFEAEERPPPPIPMSLFVRTARCSFFLSRYPTPAAAICPSPLSRRCSSLFFSPAAAWPWAYEADITHCIPVPTGNQRRSFFSSNQEWEIFSAVTHVLLSFSRCVYVNAPALPSPFSPTKQMLLRDREMGGFSLSWMFLSSFSDTWLPLRDGVRQSQATK